MTPHLLNHDELVNMTLRRRHLTFLPNRVKQNLKATMTPKRVDGRQMVKRRKTECAVTNLEDGFGKDKDISSRSIKPFERYCQKNRPRYLL